MDQWLTVESMKVFGTQVLAVGLVVQMLRAVLPVNLSGGRTQVVALCLGVGVQIAFSTPDYGVQSLVLALFNGVAVALSAMKGAEFVKPPIKALFGK